MCAAWRVWLVVAAWLGARRRLAGQRVALGWAWMSVREPGWTTRASGMSCLSASPTRARACAPWSASAGARLRLLFLRYGRRRLVADGGRATSLRGLSLGDLGYGGHDLRRHTDAARELVRGDLVRGQSEARRLGARAAAGVGLRQLSRQGLIAPLRLPRSGSGLVRIRPRRRTIAARRRKAGARSCMHRRPRAKEQSHGAGAAIANRVPNSAFLTPRNGS